MEISPAHDCKRTIPWTATSDSRRKRSRQDKNGLRCKTCIRDSYRTVWQIVSSLV